MILNTIAEKLKRRSKDDFRTIGTLHNIWSGNFSSDGQHTVKRRNLRQARIVYAHLDDHYSLSDNIVTQLKNS